MADQAEMVSWLLDLPGISLLCLGALSTAAERSGSLPQASAVVNVTDSAMMPLTMLSPSHACRLGRAERHGQDRSPAEQDNGVRYSL